MTCSHTRHTRLPLSGVVASCSRAAAARGGAALLVVVSVLPVPHALGGQLVPLQQTAVLVIVVQQINHNLTKCGTVLGFKLVTVGYDFVQLLRAGFRSAGQ